MIKFIRNIPWKDVIVAVLLGAIVIGACVGIGSALTNKTKSVSSLAFSRGEIDKNGLFEESKISICTKDLIECAGLKIEPSFEASGTYQVFYYDSNKLFVGTSDKYDTADGGFYEKGDNFAFAKYGCNQNANIF